MSPVIGIERSSHRLAIHLFRWGVHFKLRRHTTWRHLVLKVVREYDLGQQAARRALWIGWWTSRKGERSGMTGLKLAVTIVHRLKPSSTMAVPIYPRNPQKLRTPAPPTHQETT